MTQAKISMYRWRNEDLIEQGVLQIGDGYRAKNSEMGATGLPFARAGNIKFGFHLKDADLLDEENVPRAGEKVSQPGDIVFTSKGTVGRFAYVRPTTTKFVYSPQLCYWRVRDPNVLDPRFLYYWMHSHHFLDQVQQVRGLTDMADYVSLSNQRRMIITAPPLLTQRKIASVLSAYDDLIENNARRIEILEEMAQRIYLEWFVNFRFPGHEKVGMVESELGPIPEGWTIKPFKEVSLNFDSKRKPLSSAQRSEMKGKYPYYGAAKIFDYINDYIFDGQYLLVAEDGSVITKDGKPVLQMASGKFWANNHTHIIQGSSVSTNFLYLFMSGFDISGYITGAAQPKITQTNLNRIPVITPSDSLLDKFDSVVGVLLSTVEALGEQNTNLRHTRDLLLPKLISGEVDLENRIQLQVE